MTHPTLQADLQRLSLLVEHLPEYLMGESLDWSLPGRPPVRLSLGGVVMRLQRLVRLAEQLSSAEQAQLAALAQRVAAVQAESAVRFEQRAHAELHARIREWMSCLRGARICRPEEYGDHIDMRVVIAALIAALPPAALDARVLEEVRLLDAHMHRRVEPAPFVWEAVWEAAYPPEAYWYLHARMKQTTADPA